MEKRTPHCSLARVRDLVEQGKVRATSVARVDATGLGFSLSRMLSVISELTPGDFYKSMTTYADHRIWQDVYHPITEAGQLYVKLTVIDDVLIVSFKER